MSSTVVAWVAFVSFVLGWVFIFAAAALYGPFWLVLFVAGVFFFAIFGLVVL